jgi:nicotinate-nucleotide--dimethylbenzimidazole phosphoribosyltransferase
MSMSLLEETISVVARQLPIEEAVDEIQKRLDAKTKPRGSLGRLEELACCLAGIHGTADLPLPVPAVLVFAGDHGLADENVSAYPAEVTAQMVRNFAAGGAAVNVLARQAGARVIVVDMGTKTPVDVPETSVRCRRLGYGTASCLRGPAMALEQARVAIETGIHLAKSLADEGVNLLGLGEMGIGNTTSASAIAACMLNMPVAGVTGRGTGIDDHRFRHKIKVIERALALHGLTARAAEPLDVLARVGGFEIGGLAGAILGAAARRLPVLLDGFITGAAALLAVGLCPAARGYLLASHRSSEPGHIAILNHLELKPLLDLELRLGEGTGAVLAMNLVGAATRIVREMATFASAGVTDRPECTGPADRQSHRPPAPA